MTPQIFANPARVLITGGRNYNNFRMVDRVLRSYVISALCHGGATGADSLAGRTAIAIGIPVTVMKPEWGLHGKAAGHIRNREMLEQFKPDVLIAFPGGKGTNHMRRIAAEAGIPIIVVAT